MLFGRIKHYRMKLSSVKLNRMNTQQNEALTLLRDTWTNAT
jgi:hypothetical protein